MFDALQNLELSGHGLYEFRYRRDDQQVDYALWLHDLTWFAVQVKGGRHDVANTGQWTLRMPGGPPEKVQSPLEETEDGCIEMQDGIHEATDYWNLVVGLHIFTDMPLNERMEHSARERHHMHTIWGLETPADDLQRIGGEVGILLPHLEMLQKLWHLEPAPNGVSSGIASLGKSEKTYATSLTGSSSGVVPGYTSSE